MVANGHSQEENQVSSTSSSWRSAVPPHLLHAVGAERATITPPQSQYHAGMRCPHHSWRETHQSRMLVIQCMYVFDQLSGTKRVLPDSTASMAGLARGSIFTNHCVEM